jgi:hypothetical protein
MLHSQFNMIFSYFQWYYFHKLYQSIFSLHYFPHNPSLLFPKNEKSLPKQATFLILQSQTSQNLVNFFPQCQCHMQMQAAPAMIQSRIYQAIL